MLKNMENREPVQIGAIGTDEDLKVIKTFSRGSDAHKLDCVGMGYTEFPVRIETELDLIRQIREKGEIQSGGEYYTKTTKDKS